MLTFEASTANFTGDIQYTAHVYLKHRIRTTDNIAKKKLKIKTVLTQVLFLRYFN
jgi:hypothetical protein